MLTTLLRLRDSLLPVENTDKTLKFSSYNYVYGCSLYFFLRSINALEQPSFEGIDTTNKGEVIKKVFEHLESNAKDFFETDVKNFVYDDKTKEFIGEKGVEVFEEVKKLIKESNSSKEDFWKVQEDFFKDSSVFLERKKEEDLPVDKNLGIKELIPVSLPTSNENLGVDILKGNSLDMKITELSSKGYTPYKITKELKCSDYTVKKVLKNIKAPAPEASISEITPIEIKKVGELQPREEESKEVEPTLIAKVIDRIEMPKEDLSSQLSKVQKELEELRKREQILSATEALLKLLLN